MTMAVLVIDNEESLQEAVTDILALVKVDTLAATSGREGLATFRTQRAHIDAVILDLRLLGDMDGAETLRNLREIDPDVKVIVVSGYSPEHVAQQLAGLQWDVTLEKPFRMDDLLRAVRAVTAAAQ